MLNLKGSVSNSIVQARLRSGGSDYTGGLHRGSSFFCDHNGATGTLNGVTDRLRFFITSNQQRGLTVTLCGPNIADWTSYHGTGIGINSAVTQQAVTLMGGTVETSTQYDGINIYPDTGTITGTVRIYGILNS